MGPRHSQTYTLTCITLAVSVFAVGCLDPIDVSGLLPDGSFDGGDSNGDATRARGDATLEGDMEPPGPIDDADAEVDQGVAVCGDGVVGGNEACDDGNTVTESCPYGESECSVCAEDCTEQSGPIRVCGDGVLDPEEACDDGNLATGDGCDDACQRDPCTAFERAWTAVPPPGVRGRSVVLDRSSGGYAILADDRILIPTPEGVRVWNDFVMTAEHFGIADGEAESPRFAGVSHMLKGRDGVIVTSAERALTLHRGPGPDDPVAIYELQGNEVHPEGKLSKPVARAESLDGPYGFVGFGQSVYRLPLGGPAGDLPRNPETGHVAMTAWATLDGLDDGVHIARLGALDLNEDGVEELILLLSNGRLAFIASRVGADPAVRVLEDLWCGEEQALDMVGFQLGNTRLAEGSQRYGKAAVALLCSSPGELGARNAEIRIVGLVPSEEVCQGLCSELEDTLPVPFEGTRLAAGDIEGDGLPDLVVSGGASTECTGRVAGFLQSGQDGAFVATPAIAVGNNPSGVLIADIQRSDDYDAEDGVIKPNHGEIIVVNAGNTEDGGRCDQRHIEHLSYAYGDDLNQNGVRDQVFRGEEACDPPCRMGLGGPACTQFIYEQVAAGTYHNCGITSPDRNVRCWGADWHNDGSLIPGVLTPPPLGDGEVITRLSASTAQTCAILQTVAPGDGEDRPSSRVSCWPADYDVSPEEGLTEVSVGPRFSCRVVNGSVSCWSRPAEDNGEDAPPVNLELPILQGADFDSVSVADRHACGRASNAEVSCWASQNAPDGAASIPTNGNGAPIAFRQIAVGDLLTGVDEPASFSCGLKLDDEVKCWGAGIGGFEPPDNMKFHAIEVDDGTACGIATTGRIHCWGAHTGLSDGAPAGLYRSISVGRGHACAVTMMGTVRCWGEGSHPICDHEDSALLPACQQHDQGQSEDPPTGTLGTPDPTDRNNTPQPPAADADNP